MNADKEGRMGVQPFFNPVLAARSSCKGIGILFIRFRKDAEFVLREMPDERTDGRLVDKRLPGADDSHPDRPDPVLDMRDGAEEVQDARRKIRKHIGDIKKAEIELVVLGADTFKLFQNGFGRIPPVRA